MIIKGKINNKQICPMNIFTNTTPNENLITKDIKKQNNNIQWYTEYKSLPENDSASNTRQSIFKHSC